MLSGQTRTPNVPVWPQQQLCMQTLCTCRKGLAFYWRVLWRLGEGCYFKTWERSGETLWYFQKELSGNLNLRWMLYRKTLVIYNSLQKRPCTHPFVGFRPDDRNENKAKGEKKHINGRQLDACLRIFIIWIFFFFPAILLFSTVMFLGMFSVWKRRNKVTVATL